MVSTQVPNPAGSGSKSWGNLVGPHIGHQGPSTFFPATMRWRMGRLTYTHSLGDRAKGVKIIINRIGSTWVGQIMRRGSMADQQDQTRSTTTLASWMKGHKGTNIPPRSDWGKHSERSHDPEFDMVLHYKEGNDQFNENKDWFSRSHVRSNGTLWGHLGFCSSLYGPPTVASLAIISWARLFIALLSVLSW